MKYIKKKNGEFSPKNKKRLLVVILCEGKDNIMKYVKNFESEISVNGHTYFIMSKGVYNNRYLGRISVYLEGISTPLTHDNIEFEEQKVLVETIHGTTETHDVRKIKGLKFDSELIDTLLNRRLAEEFMKLTNNNNLLLFAVLLAGAAALISLIGVILPYV